MTRHLSLADVEALHVEMMRATGWHPAPFRSGGEALLESALMDQRCAPNAMIRMCM